VQYSADEMDEIGAEESHAHAHAGADLDPISHDEVLDVHDMLREFKGSFKELLRSKDPGAN
jgi:propanediol dehydratase small subunit